MSSENREKSGPGEILRSTAVHESKFDPTSQTVLRNMAIHKAQVVPDQVQHPVLSGEESSPLAERVHVASPDLTPEEQVRKAEEALQHAVRAIEEKGEWMAAQAAKAEEAAARIEQIAAVMTVNNELRDRINRTLARTATIRARTKKFDGNQS
jgi:hypothetical protein